MDQVGLREHLKQGWFWIQVGGSMMRGIDVSVGFYGVFVFIGEFLVEMRCGNVLMSLQEISTEANSQIYEGLESARIVWNINIAESARQME